MQRPSGITVLAILYFVSGGLSLVTSCFAMVVGNWLAVTAERPGAFPMLLAPASAFRGQLAFWLGLIGTAAALFKLVAAIGLWTMQPWGWRLALFSGTLKLVTHVVAANRRAITGRRRGRAGQWRHPRLPVHSTRAASTLGRSGRRPPGRRSRSGVSEGQAPRLAHPSRRAGARLSCRPDRRLNLSLLRRPRIFRARPTTGAALLRRYHGMDHT